MAVMSEREEANHATRMNYYEKYFGTDYMVFHEIIPLHPHIDVYVFKPTAQFDYYILVSSGMSDEPMNIPEQLPKDFARAEIIFPVHKDIFEQDKTNLGNTVRVYASLPHAYNTFLFQGHTSATENPAVTLFPQISSQHTHALFVFADEIGMNVPDEFYTGLKVDDGENQVFFLALVPINEDELEIKLEKGTDVFVENLKQSGETPFIYKGDR
jgi:hypothetical protein